eukprot:COSAG06_NODE_46728_length_344_cov_1.273469_1_plen_32_part_10
MMAWCASLLQQPAHTIAIRLRLHAQQEHGSSR